MTAAARALPPGRTRQLLEAHALRAAGGRGRNEVSLLRPDHVVVEAEDAPMVLAALDVVGAARVASEVGLLGSSRAAAPLAAEPAVLEAVEAARRRGWFAVRPGHGRAEFVYLDHFCAPGKLVVGTGEGVPAAGALGALALRVSPLEAAAALAGAPLEPGPLRVEMVRLRGRLAPRVGGTDAALALARRIGPARMAGAVLELCGRGAESMPMADRFAWIAAATRLGARAVLGISDETTRRFLDARRREPEWKRFGLDDADDPGDALDLDAVEPMIVAWMDAHPPRPVRQALGMRVGRVRFGARATHADLVGAARILKGRRIDPGVVLVIAPGSRSVAERAAEDGTLDILATSGAVFVGGGWSPVRRTGTDAAGLCFGLGGTDPGGDDAWWVAGVATCAAAALHGRLVDPRAVEADSAPEDEAELAVVSVAPLEPLAADDAPPPAPHLVAGARGGELRGPVLIALGDDVGAGHVLPWGARRAARAGDAASLASGVFDSESPGFAARAHAAGGGMVVAGRAFGAGDPVMPAALALAALGVHAVIAESFAPGFHAALVQAGVVPLRVGAADRPAIARGDELEIPGFPEALVPGRPLAVRDLTRGTQHTLVHDLDGAAIETLAAGGLLARRQASTARGEARARGAGERA